MWVHVLPQVGMIGLASENLMECDETGLAKALPSHNLSIYIYIYTELEDVRRHHSRPRCRSKRPSASPPATSARPSKLF